VRQRHWVLALGLAGSAAVAVCCWVLLPTSAGHELTGDRSAASASSASTRSATAAAATARAIQWASIER
jgi:hypothetical protein